MSETVEVEYLLTVNADLTVSELRKIETMLVRVASYIQRISGSEDLDRFMAKINQTIAYLRALQIAYAAVEAALIPGAGWVKAAWAGFAIVNAGFAGYDAMRGY